MQSSPDPGPRFSWNHSPLPGRGLVAAGLLIMGGTLASRLLGFLRETAVAAQFGAGEQVDAFLLAVTLPLSLVHTAAAGLGAAVVSILTECRQHRGEAESFRLVRTIINSALIAAVAVLALAYLARPLILGWLAGAAPAPTRALAETLAPSLLLLTIPSVLAPVLSGVLHAYARFGAPAWRTPAANLATVAVLFTAAPQLGIWALVLGYLAGQFIQLPFLWVALRRLGYRHGWEWRWRDPMLRRLLGIGGPSMGIMLLSAVNLFLERGLAAGLPRGSVAALGYSSRLMHLPLGLLAMSLVTVAYPALAAGYQTGGPAALAGQLRFSLRLLAFLLVPVALVLGLYPLELTALVFERGAFGPADTALTAGPLPYFALALIPAGLRPLQLRAFFVLQDGWTPMGVALLSAVAYYVTGATLVTRLGAPGLALAEAASHLTALLLMGWFLRRRLPAEGRQESWRALFRLGLSAGMAAAVSLGLHGPVGRMPLLAAHPAAAALCLAGITVLIFLVSAWLLGSEELQSGLRLLRPGPPRGPVR